MHNKNRIARGRAFEALHGAERGFIMPNAWDAGSAVLLEAAGFKAIATTSAGIAFSMGRPDYNVGSAGCAVSREAMFSRVREIADAVTIPVSADLEAGYGDRPEDVAETIAMAMEAGLAGANLEDRIPGKEGLYEESLAAERIVAAREVIDSKGGAFVLTARTDAFFFPTADDALGEAIRRMNRFRDAGADCLYAPGPTDLGTIGRLVEEVNGPMNIVMGLGNAEGNANELLAAGVQRISLGGSLARSALAFIKGCAEEIQRSGTVDFARIQMPQAELNAMFERALSAVSSRDAEAEVS